MVKKIRVVSIDGLRPWTPFQKAEALGFGDGATREQVISSLRKTGFSDADIEAALKAALEDDLYINSRYQVAVRYFDVHPTMPKMIHLSIRRLDREQVGPEKWRDF